MVGEKIGTEPLFHAYAFRRLGEDAQDMVQSAFVSIFKGLRRYKGPRFFPWAYRICVNEVTDTLRKKRVRAGVGVSTLTEDRNQSSSNIMATPEEELMARQLFRSMSDALKKLPEGQRSVFTLARIEGMEYSEISELLNIQLGKVKSRMFKAVEVLFGKGASK